MSHSTLGISSNRDVLIAIEAFLDYSPLWTLSQAAIKGHRHLLERIAYRQPFDQLDPFFRQWIYTKAMAQAASSGRLAFMKWLTTQFPGCFITVAVEEAAANGHLAVLQWLLGRHPDVKWGADEMNYALRNNHFQVAQWLYQHVPQSAEREMKAAAAESGSLEVVKWAFAVWPPLHDGGSVEQNYDITAIMAAALRSGSTPVVEWIANNRGQQSLEFTSLDEAAVLGHFDVIKWMTKHNLGRCSNECLEKTGANGHFELAKWIFDNRSDGCGGYPKDSVASQSNVEIVKWFAEKTGPMCFSESAMDLAAANGHLNVVRYLHDSGYGCSDVAMDDAATNGHLEIVKFLHDNRTEGCTTAAMDGAAKNGRLDVIEWLHEHRREGCTDFAMNLAAENNHRHVVQWLHENRTEGCTDWALTGAATGGHLEMLKWLQEHRHLSYSGNSPVNPVDLAAGGGHLEAFRWLINTQGVRPTSAAMAFAVEQKQFAMLLILRSEFGVRPTDIIFLQAIQRKELEILQWLLHHFPDAVGQRTLVRSLFTTTSWHVRHWLRDNGYLDDGRTLRVA